MSADSLKPYFPGHSTPEAYQSKYIETPNGSKLWTPVVPSGYLPEKDSHWGSLDLACSMYEAYAEKAGFTVRKSSSKNNKYGLLTHKLYTCNKAGKPKKRISNYTLPEKQDLDQDSSKKERKKRNVNFKVTNCPARIKLKKVRGSTGFHLYHFEPKHNHVLGLFENKHLSRAHRQLEYEDENWLTKLSLTNNGATRAHRLRSILKGGYDQVNGTVTDWKNFKRDINSVIGTRDAQMLVDKLKNHNACNSKFSYNCNLENTELVGLFWADETSKCNYTEFGDVVSFDATYNTNCYGMVFVPFTGVDHHNKCVTFGAGLLKYENIESFTWILSKFRDAHGKEPTLILSDQDPAMKQAVPLVFKESHHRLCMWHITRKLPLKICPKIYNEDFRRRVNKLVWNLYIGTSEFERRWESLIAEFNLQNHKWLSDMYNIRHLWIPSYFRDLPMCCLMKTTSRSESSNAFFQIFSHHSNTLVQFMLCFEAAMEKQRHTQRVLDNHTTETTPEYKTLLPIEVHANSVYTRAIFVKVQEEIVKGIWSCSEKYFHSDDGTETSIVKHNKDGKLLAEYKVVRNLQDGSIKCRCDHFHRHGYLCRHIFCVFKTLGIHQIPEQYIMRRWERDALPKELLKSHHRYGQYTSEYDKLSREAISSVEFCVGRMRNHPQLLSTFVENIRKLKSEFMASLPSTSKENDKEERIAKLLGVTIPPVVSIKPPSGIKNKGRPRGGRLRGPGEKHVEKRKRQYKLCKECNKIVNDHDSRNCKKIKAQKLAQKKAQQQAKRKGKKKVQESESVESDESYESDESDEDEDYM